MAKVIVGIDYSISSPGIVIFTADDDWTRTKTEFFGFTDVKKNSAMLENLLFYKKDYFKSEQERYDYISTQSMMFINGVVGSNSDVWVAIEGYALGSTKGLVFNIAEATGLMKHKVWQAGYKLRVYEPTAIKKFATGKGNVDKVSMGDSFFASKDEFKPILPVGLADYKSPKADIIDAYWIASLLYTELLLRNGIVRLRDLSEKQIEVFNATSKSNPDNIICRDFVQK